MTDGGAGLWAVDGPKILQHVTEEAAEAAVGVVNVEVLPREGRRASPVRPRGRGSGRPTVLALHEHAVHLDVKEHLTAALWVTRLQVRVHASGFTLVGQRGSPRTQV